MAIETRMLPVRLTDDEFMIRSSELAETLGDLAAAENEKKRVATRFKDRIEGIEDEVHKLRLIVQNKEEDRAVEVHERFNRRRRVVEIYRADTGETVDYRDMTEIEKQNEAELFSETIDA
jgi:hypothetical protein